MNITSPVPTDRRRFLLSSTAAVAAGLLTPPRAIARQQTSVHEQEQEQEQKAPPLQEPTEAHPPSDRITENTFIEAEKLHGVHFTREERTMMRRTIEQQIDRGRTRLQFPMPGNEVAPAVVFDPRVRGATFDHLDDRFVPSEADPDPLPEKDEDIAFAPVRALSHWIRTGQLSSVRLTELYLKRLKEFDPQLECVVTLTEHLARRQAQRADAEIAAGFHRGPLHGIPWGAKDLLDTAGIRTTWGATPYAHRVPDTDAVVVRRLEEAGAVLLAKLSLGALAYGDIWFAGRTRNPWNVEQGSSGSSAGTAAAAAAGLIPFGLGTETYGSIVSPCMRCGVTGLRPTFGRVARTGAMALCWSLDKIGPICRTVEDCMLVLNAINGPDEGDPSSVEMPLPFNARQPVGGLRVGYDPTWFEEASVIDRQTLELLPRLGIQLVNVQLPDWPYDVLLNVLYAEAASAFEDLTLSDRDDELVWQEPQAWPNSFRQTRFLSAIELVQAQRFRRQVMEMFASAMEGVDLLISPSFEGNLLLITNNTGHPSLTLRNGFEDDGTPHGITLWGQLYEEGVLCSVGMALERELGVWDVRPRLG